MFSKVKGYNKLTEAQQNIFKLVHKRHMQVVEDQTVWQPASVRVEGTCLKVTFQNGEWLHYTRELTWY